MSGATQPLQHVKTQMSQLYSKTLEFKNNPTLITFDPNICFSHHPDVCLSRPNQLFPTATAESEWGFPWVWCKLDTFQKVCVQTNTQRCENTVSFYCPAEQRIYQASVCQIPSKNLGSFPVSHNSVEMLTLCNTDDTVSLFDAREYLHSCNEKRPLH